MRNVFHFNIFQNNVDFIINIILQKIVRGCEVIFFYCRYEKCIYQCSLYILFEIIIFLFYIENCVAPFIQTELFLYTICLEDISKGIWIVRIGMYFLGFYKVSLNNYITISIAMKVEIRGTDFGNIPYKLKKIFYRFELLYVPLLTFQLLLLCRCLCTYILKQLMFVDLHTMFQIQS